MARPTKYSKEIADKICQEIATTSKGLNAICKIDGMPSVRTVYNWLNDSEFAEFLQSYTRAREAQADLIAEEIIQIADDSSNDTMTIKKGDEEIEVENKEWVNRSRLRVDARKWIASKLAPKKYGDKVDVKAELTGELSVKQITGMEIK